MNQEEFDMHVFKFNNTPTTKNTRKSFNAMRKEVIRLKKMIEDTYNILNNSDLDKQAILDNLYEVYYD